jgi:RIO kinase 2
MKLDPTVMRTMNAQDFRVLEAVEKGMKNHALVPLPLITSIANLRHGGTNKIISSLLRDNLLSHECRKQGYDGYRITNAGYDILALQNLKSRGFVAAFGMCLKYLYCLSLSWLSLSQ